MKNTLLLSVFTLLLFPLNIYAGPNDSNLTDREKIQQEAEKSRQELNNAGAPANSSSAPTQVDTRSWNIDSSTTYEITNHLFGYSTLIDKDFSYHGVKITGFMNLAFYSPDKNNDGTRKKIRLEVGIEDNLFNISNRSAVFLGGGAVMGDGMGIYADTGVEFYLLSWFKAQGGINYNSSNGHLTPKISIGLVW